ncbi:helix-turn-helix domain-containing protein [Nonomuraea sp. B10E15]|uniref:helix-turn-helix domain-containing protein n=1 Tax=unclassified Nonomuraea TaxID=2593643 RepID=UPI00325E6941
MLRQWHEEHDAPGWPRADDPGIAAALRAAILLRESDAPLAAIARQVGYSTEFAFSAAFRREYGMSPGGFRRTPVMLAERASSGGR